MFATLSLAPPARGKMLLVPVGGEAASDLLPRALAAGALLVDRGPIAGSLIVEGDRATLSPAIGSVLILAAPRSGCTSTGVTA